MPDLALSVTPYSCVGQRKMGGKKYIKYFFIDIPQNNSVLTIIMSDQLPVSMCLFMYYLGSNNSL